MTEQALRTIIKQAVADYGYRLAVMWGADDVIAGMGLSAEEAKSLKERVVPELLKLPNPVEPRDHDAEQERLARIAFRK